MQIGVFDPQAFGTGGDVQFQNKNGHITAARG
jgi:hypothetical protein